MKFVKIDADVIKHFDELFPSKISYSDDEAVLYFFILMVNSMFVDLSSISVFREIIWAFDFYLKVPCSTKVAKVKRGPPAWIGNTGSSGNNIPTSSNVKTSTVVSCKTTSIPRSGETVSRIAAVPAPCSMDMSPSKSDDASVSLDETMSTCDSYKSPEVEYIDNNDVPAADSLNRKTFSNLYISDHAEIRGCISEQGFSASNVA